MEDWLLEKEKEKGKTRSDSNIESRTFFWGSRAEWSGSSSEVLRGIEVNIKVSTEMMRKA